MFQNTVITYRVFSNNQIKLIGKKRILQLQQASELGIVEGLFSQYKLQFMNQINIKEQISVLCSFQCQYSGKVDKYQLLYKRYQIPNIIKQLSTDKIFLEDYYQNTMYSDKYHVIGFEAYMNSEKKPLPYKRIELIKYPEKQIIFSYNIKVECHLFTFQIMSIYDTLLICDDMNILVYSLQDISLSHDGTSKSNGMQADFTFSFKMNYPNQVDKFAYFSQIDPYVYLNLYGIYDFLENKFFSQPELLIYSQKQPNKIQLMESKTHLYYILNLKVFFYEKQKSTQEQNAKLSQDSVVFFLNQQDSKLNLEKDFMIGLTQLNDGQYVQIVDYKNLTPIKLFYQFEKESFNQNGYYFYCWQYQKLFLRYDNSIVGYDYPFADNQEPFFVFKNKKSIPRACSNTFLITYEERKDDNIFKITIIEYQDQRILKDITLNTNQERINIELFVNQTNVGIIEDKQIVVIGNILISTSQSDLYYIFQESKFHYSPSLDIAFIHQQSLEKYIQVIDLSQIFPFVLERFSFENKLIFQNYFLGSKEYYKEPIKMKEVFEGRSNQIKYFQDKDMIFINLNLNSVCVYNIGEQYYQILNLPKLVDTPNLQALKNRKMQYLVYLNKSPQDSFAVIKFDREFYLYSRNQYLKTLNLYDYQEIYADGKDDLVYIYGFKDNQLYYLTIDNNTLDFQIKQVDLSQHNFQNFLLMDMNPNLQFALIDINYNLIAQNSSEDISCLLKLPQEFVGQARGIQVVRIQIEEQKNQYIFVWISNILKVYNFKCEQIWSKNNIDDGVQIILEDNQTQQIYFADKYSIYVIQYIDLLKKQDENNIIVAQLPLQARNQIKFQKLNRNLLAVLSASNIYIFEVYKSFTLIFYITNKDFFYIQQVFYVLEEFFIISDINRLYIYQILKNDNDKENNIANKSVNRISGSSSYSSASSINTSYSSNQGDNSEYYSQKQFYQRKLAVPFYQQTNLFLQIQQVDTFQQEDGIFIRIVGSDYNNLIDLTKQLVFNNINKKDQVPNIQFENNNNNFSKFGKAVQNQQEQTKDTCRGKYIIHEKKDYQIIQYDTIYSQNDGLYNQINFKFPSKKNNLNTKSEQENEGINDLFIPNSLKLKTKIASYFIYDLSNKSVLLFPQFIKSSVICKLKIMNGIIYQQKGFFRQMQSKENSDTSSQKDTNNNEFSNDQFNINFIQFFQLVHFQNIELRQTISFVNCEQVILQDIFIPYENLSEQISLSFFNITTLTIQNLTVHSKMLQSQLITVANSKQVNITNLNVFDDSQESYSFPYFQLSQSFGWISIQKSQNVSISNVNFTRVNANIDLFFLQYIEYVDIQNFLFSNMNLNFIEDQSDSGLPINQNSHYTQFVINDKGEMVQQDQQVLSYYINLPVNIQEVSSIFRIVFIQRQLSIKNIILEDSNVSMLLHQNKSISRNSSTNVNINEQYSSTNLEVNIFNLTFTSLYQIQSSICYLSDFILIEAESVTIDTLNIKQTSCFQSIVRLQNVKQSSIKNVDIIKAITINFLFYFYKNQNIIIENVIVQENNQLNHIFGIIKCDNSQVKNLKVYPYQLSKPKPKQITQLKIKNSAILIYNNQDNPKLVSKSEATIIDSLIQYFQSINSNGTAIQIYEVALKLQNVQLSYNQAGLNGGAIYLHSSSLVLSNTAIQFNNATFSGGGIFSTNSIIEIEDNLTDQAQKTVIQQNFAAIGGGIRYFRQNIDYILSTPGCLKNNRAIFFGQDYTNYPSKLVVKNADSFNTLKKVVSSISQIEQEISFYWVDEQNKKLKYTSEEINMKSSTKYQSIQRELNQYTTLYMSSERIWINRVKAEIEIEVKGVIISDGDGQQYIKTSQNYLLKSNQLASLKVKTFINYPQDEGSTFSQKEIIINLQFRECVAGEIFNAFNENVYECLECKDNTYSLIQPSSFENKCIVCPDNAEKCFKNIIEINEEYWIEPNTTNIYYCFNNPKKCQPQQVKGCSKGGFGPRCESCDYSGSVWEGQSYTRQGIYDCKECGEEQISQYILVSLFIIIFPIFFNYLAYQATFEASAIIQAYYLKRAGIINIGLLYEKIRFSNIIKFLINYIQILSTLAFFNFQIPYTILLIIQFVGNPFQISIYLLDCLFIRQGWIYSLEIIYIRMIWILINTVLYAIFSYLIVRCFSFFKYKQYHQKQDLTKRFLITSMFYLHFMIFPSLVSQSINILSCENIGTKKYIYSDNQFLCYSQQHLFIGFPISVTLIILMLILFPAYIYFELKANKNNLFRTQFFLRFKFFFSEYKKSCYYWEIVKFVQKGLIYIGLSIYNENQTTKGALLSFIMALYIRQLYSQQPYKRLFLNKIDYAASFTLLLCFQLGMINMSTNNINIKHSSLYLVILLNTLFFIYFIMLLFKEKIQYNRNNFMFSCIQAALRKLPFLKDYFQLTEKLYLSHRGWKKLQEAIKRVGYQKLTLYCLHKDQKITSSYAHLLGINLQSSESSDEVSIKIKKSKELEKIQTKPSLTSKNLVYKKSIHHLSKLNDLNNKKPIIPKVISSQQQLELVNFSEQSQSLRVANENAFNSEKIEDKIKEDHSLKTECDDNNPELNQKIEEKQVIQTLPDSYNIKTIHSIKTNQCL